MRSIAAEEVTQQGKDATSGRPGPSGTEDTASAGRRAAPRQPDPRTEVIQAMDELPDHHLTELLVSYDRLGGMNDINRHNMPSKRAVGQLCEDLLQLLFPGYHDDDAFPDGMLPSLTAERLFSVVRRLQEQVRKSVRIGDPKRPTGKTAPIIKRFTGALPSVRERLQTDIEAAFEGDPSALNREEIILAYPFIEAIAIQRLAHCLYEEGAPIVPRMMTEWAHARTGIDIHPGAQIGSHFFIDHGTGVVVGETCRIGNHVKLFHGVTLGARSFAKDEAGHIVKGTKRHPDVEDHVTIYPNATILGGETVVGSHSTIGANVFLMQSVAPHSLVIYEEKQLRFLDKRRRGRNEGLEYSI